MTLIELDWFYEKLLNTKKDEKEAHDKALEGLQNTRVLPKLAKPYRRRR